MKFFRHPIIIDRITPNNASKYIGHRIMYRIYNTRYTATINGVCLGRKCVYVNHPELKNRLNVLNRKIYVI